MADEITIKLEADFEKAQKNWGKAKTVLSGDDQRRGESLLTQIKGMGDASKMSSQELTKLSHLIDSFNKLIIKGAQNLGKASDEFVKAAKKLSDLEEKRSNLTSQRDVQNQKRKEASSKVNDYFTNNPKGVRFVNTKTGRQVKNPSTIADLGNDLEVRNAQGTKLTGAAATTAMKKTGIQDYLDADKEYKSLNQQIKTVDGDINAQQIIVEKLEAQGGISPEGQAMIGDTQSLSSSVQSLRDLKNEEISDTVHSTNDEIEKLPESVDKGTSSFAKAFKQISLTAIAFRTVKKAITDAITTLKSLDRSLTEQAMVIGKTRSQTYALLSTYQELATETGATTKEISTLVTEFTRQGKTTQESLVLTKAAMSAAKVASISATDSVNYLTTALNGFGLSAEDAMSVSDKFAMVAASSATSYDELATALSKVASQANLAGMSIDYTTALLAKGLETTREAPETMGTALKTIIARMREIGDYGETLEGDTDLNNVESQLAYVGIALRTTTGELRSTEDVLDDLGKKWDTLNSNQQAAVAKALAGTRQQSRLIAMMSDYERVLELQEVSERSSGATLSQMSTYLQGMEAALNNVSVAWESIVTSLVNSEVIIGTVQWVANILEKIGDILSTTAGSVALYGTLLILAANMASKKLLENKIAKENYAIEQQKYTTQLKQREVAIKQAILDAKAKVDAQEKVVSAQEEYIIKLKALQIEKKDKGATEAELLALDAQIGKEEVKLKTENTQLETLRDEYHSRLAEQEVIENSLALQSQSATLANVASTAWSGLVSIVSTLAIVLKTVLTLHKQETRQLIKNWAIEKKKLITEKMSAGWKMAGSAAETPITGWVIAAGILAALGIGLGIAAISGAFDNNSSSAENAADKINELSNSIYQLENKARSIDTIVDSYDDLNNQIIKTKANQEEMNELLEQASDKLTDEEATAYNALTTNAQKRNYLAAISAKASSEADADRQKQLSYVDNLSASQRAKILASDATDSDILTTQSAIYAINNNFLYDYIDNLKDAKDGVQELAQALLEELTPAEAYAFAKSPEQINELAQTLNSLVTQVDGEETGVAGILTSDDYSIVEKVEAYRQALGALDDQMGEILTNVYSDIAAFASFNDTVLQFVADNGLTADGINTLGTALSKLGYDSDEATVKLGQLFETIATGTDIASAINEIFGELSDEDYNKIINAYSSAIGTGVLNMGQNITSLKSQIESFYEKAGEWSSMSDTDKTAFLADNADLFKGAGGKELLAAIESGDYNFIQSALGDNETLKSKVAQQIKDIDTELAIENAKLESERDEAYIKYLQEQKELLEDVDSLYAASLDTRLEQEQNYLNEYKSYLEDQRDALKDSLDERKEAYQDYFDTVNQEAEDEDFEEQESTLIANIAKLATSTSADAVNQSATLEQELKDLEEERLDTLRERAQEEIIDNIEKTIEDIDDKFDDLLNSQQALLAAMTGELDDPTGFISKLISNKMTEEGLTELGLEDYIQTLGTTYGPLLGSDIFSNIDAAKQGDSWVLNIAGTEVVLSNSDQQTLYTALLTAMKQIGLK